MSQPLTPRCAVCGQPEGSNVLACRLCAQVAQQLAFTQMMTAMKPSWVVVAEDEVEIVPPELPKEIVAAPVEAWRLWTVEKPETMTVTAEGFRQVVAEANSGVDPFGYRLRSVGLTDHVWSKVEHAECYGGSAPPIGHPAPGAHCQCGLWAFKDLETLWETPAARGMHASRLWAYGKVLMWGKLIECENGWRAEHAKPVEVSLVDSLGDREVVVAAERQLAEFYGCDVTAVPPPPIQKTTETDVVSIPRLSVHLRANIPAGPLFPRPLLASKLWSPIVKRRWAWWQRAFYAFIAFAGLSNLVVFTWFGGDWSNLAAGLGGIVVADLTRRMNNAAPRGWPKF